TCGEKAEVQSFLGAARQPCGRCGQLLMGPLEHRSSNSAKLWLGVLAGALVGVGLVVTVARLGPAIPSATRGAVLGALSGVLLAPVFAMASFIAMLVLPFSLDGILGNSLWTRLARALHERRARYLLLPVLVFLVLPMAACALGGSKMQNPNALLVSAGLGAVVLGAVVGGVCGTLAGGVQLSADNRSARRIEEGLPPPAQRPS